jgi:magnesium transporter
VVWADVEKPNDEDATVLRDVFGFHSLAVESALQDEQHPKIESYVGYLYLVLHGINFDGARHTFDTHDTDFFLGSNYVVTVHDGGRRSIARVAELSGRNSQVLAEGPVALVHRIVDAMVYFYRPEVDELEKRLEAMEKRVIQNPDKSLTGGILKVKGDITRLRRIVVPQRDVVGRLSRREFDQINQEMSYRFRDVYDQLARMTEDAIVFQDRVTGILDAHLAGVSNKLAQVSKLLAVIAALFGPMTVMTGLFGMNVPLPSLFAAPEYQFWEIVGLMVLASAGLFIWFRSARWL